MTEVCYGHEVPPFKQVFVKLFRAGLAVMSLQQIKDVAAQLTEELRTTMGDFLGAEGSAQVLHELPQEVAEFIASSYRTGAGTTERAFRAVYPQVMVATNNALSPAQLGKVLSSLTSEDIASQSLFLGDEGRAYVFSRMSPEAVRTILDRTDDWVFLETGRRAISDIAQYSAILEKRERVGNKLQDVETIALKVRNNPHAVYMKWLAGPFKGRELIYNGQLVGRDKVRVREGGVLGIVPVTIGVDSAVARRGTNHMVTEVGLAQLVELIERDYRKAAPAGDIKRVNHGISKLDGHNIYKMETVLPRDPKRGYYCYRMVHYTDYVAALEIKAEVYNFNDELAESYYYKDLDTTPGFSERDFDPSNKSYKL